MNEQIEVSKKKFYTTWWFGAIVVLGLIIVSNIHNSSSNEVVPPTQTNTTVVSAQTAPTTPVTATKSKTITSTPTTAATQSKTVPVVTSVPVTPAMWHTVYTYSNNTDIQTPPFSMQGSRWRIGYNCALAYSANPYSNFNGVIDTVTGGGLNGSGDGNVFANNVTCPTSNSSYIYSLNMGGSLKPGQYYLNVGGYNSSYSVTVEDYY